MRNFNGWIILKFGYCLITLLDYEINILKKYIDLKLNIFVK